MPYATEQVRRASLRLVVLLVLSAIALGAFNGIARADTTPTPRDPSGTTGTSQPTDPGTPTDPSAPSGPSGPSDGSTASTTSTGSTTTTAPAITFGLPTAASNTRAAHVRSVRARHELEVHAVLREAWRQRGKPYVYGADGPRSFDCSGLVRYVFGHAVGRWLPHNAAAQYDVVEHITRRQLRPGDLVFQESGGYPFHVGIYAGHDEWWHAPHTGDTVRKQRIYRGHLFYGRVLTTGYAKRSLARHHARRHTHHSTRRHHTRRHTGRHHRRHHRH